MAKSFQAFRALIARDMAVYWPAWPERFFNSLIWAVLNIMVFEYIMPQMGLERVGMFMAAGMIASFGFFEVTENIARFVADLDGERSISYYLTLPLPQWAVFVRLAITNALQAIFVAVTFVPVFKLLLGTSFQFTHFDPFKFVLIFLLIHLFYGFFSLCLAAYVESLDKMGNVWIRIVFPLWWIGCFQFSWQTLYKVQPWVAWLDLLNPLTYIMEGVRAAIIGQEGYLNFWLCCAAVVIFTFIVGMIGIIQLRKRLDCL